MKQILILLFVVSLVAGMIVPAMADEGVAGNGVTQKADSDSGASGDAIAATDPSATVTSNPVSGDNSAGVTVNVKGQNVATNSVTQSQTAGPQNNKAFITLLGGDGAAGGSSGAATNIVGTTATGLADSDAGAGSPSADVHAKEIENNDDVGVEGSGNAEAKNIGSGNAEAISKSEAETGKAGNGGDGGNAKFDGNFIQVNANVQIATANIKNHQNLEQKVKVDLEQDSKAEAEDLTAVAKGYPDASTNNDAISKANPEIENSFTFSELEMELLRRLAD